MNVSLTFSYIWEQPFIDRGLYTENPMQNDSQSKKCHGHDEKHVDVRPKMLERRNNERRKNKRRQKGHDHIIPGHA